MSKSSLRIITRESPLAMWQAEFVQNRLMNLFPNINITIMGITTQADQLLDASLENLGGKGAFVKELEIALLNGDADIAVHSMKDVVVDLPESLSIPVILKRTHPGDSFISNNCNSLNKLPMGSVVGTSSLRRECQLKSYRSDLIIRDIRGNVGTRLRKMDNGEYDALILATAGLTRLGLDERIRHELSQQIMMPAIGQGALGIEIRTDDADTLNCIKKLNDRETFLCVSAERMVNKCLNGGCHSPIAAHAVIENESISISALVGSADGKQIIQSEVSGPAQSALELGNKVGVLLLEKGAERILKEFQSIKGQE
ncbi:MAG: hydroxymethylbilane synthase [Gammaproteobacteria bacterium]|jgi:hydroxymethylbilane synthase